jgi:hypothetical protein
MLNNNKPGYEHVNRLINTDLKLTKIILILRSNLNSKL